MAIPKAVEDAFEKVKAKEPGYITLKSIKNGYYVYRQSGKWDPKKKATKTIAEYLGKITDDGLFIRKKLSAKDDLENAKSLIAAHGGEIIWHEKPEEIEGVKETTIRELTTDEIDAKLLTILSMNARADLAYWARQLGLSEQAIYYRVKRLEEKLGIEYITEINVEKLGYLKFIGFVKFLGSIPEQEELRSAFEKDGRVQLVLLTSGRYDVVFFLYAQTNLEIGAFAHKIRVVEPLFRKYKARWFITPYLDSFGFLPTRDAFLDLIRDQVEKKRQEKIYKDLTIRDIVVLKDLNTNGDKSFTKIDEDNKLDKGGADYSYYKLKSRGYIVRTTIGATNLPIKFNAIVILEITDGIKFGRGRPDLLQEIVRNGKLASKYAMVGDIEMPHSGIFFLPVFDEEDLQKTQSYMNSKIKGVNPQILIVQKFILGSFCYRRFDEQYTDQYELLVNEYKIFPAVQKIDYDIGGKIKKL